MQLIVSFPVLLLCMLTLNDSRVLYFIIKLFDTKKHSTLVYYVLELTVA